jgi:hypothetical protein
VVGKVLVDVGQYVQPGNPLLTLTGTGGRELEVSVPNNLLAGLAIGQSFLIDGKMVGSIDRIAGVGEGGSVKVVIALTSDTNWLVGSSVIGYLEANTGELVYALPRSHIFFDSNGPYITYEDDESVPVEILYDAGEQIFLRVPNNNPIALKSVAKPSL